ncbi:hypothetical protein [Bradyrhizobium sp.]|uniref:hypothetical protein n=1 Tax=Bradyrhizobium sp. TaxID=376 RepID=UPI003C7CA983
MLPPSRGSRKAGAFAPSVKAGLPAAGAPVFPIDAIPADGFPATGFAAVDIDRDEPFGAVAPDDLNCFDGGSCDPLEVASLGCLVAVLLDLFATARRVFEGGVFAVFPDGAWGAFPEDAFGDFLRVFLDIRLPFVAFGGSIMGYC